MNKLKELQQQRKALLDEAYTLLENGELEASEQKETEADEVEKEIKAEETRLERMKALNARREANRQPAGAYDLPGGGGGSTIPASPVDERPEETPEESFQKSLNLLRYSSVDLSNLSVDELCNFKAMQELYGGDYRQINNDQNVAFQHFLRRKGEVSSLSEVAPLGKMYWPISRTVGMLKAGYHVNEIKATMIEGSDVLGGYAVPPERADMILKRAMGLTAVRQAGALVIETASKMITWLKLTDGNTRYPTSMRGAYGSETQSPAGDDFNVGEVHIPVHLYTYKVAFSVSLLEDAENMVDIFTNLVAETLALDEDNDFLIGDGANKPRGITPGQANGESLTEVVTGSATALTMDGLKKLRRGVASQYRQAGRFTIIGNNQSGEDLELLTDGEGRYFFPEGIMAGAELLRGTAWRESEALPDAAANTYSLIGGDFSGYAIVERLGMAIQRYNDSNTGINVVEFHIRRRIGGKVVEPWKLAVSKTASS